MTDQTLAVTSPGTITDTSLPIGLADPIINAGSMFLIDALRIGCWNPDIDTVANGATVGNLVDGAPTATIEMGTGGLSFVSGKGFEVGAAASGQGRIQIGAGTDYFQADLTDDYLLIAWAIYPDTDPTGHIGLLLTKMLSTGFGAVGPWLAYRYVNSGRIDGRFDSSTATTGFPDYQSAGSPAGLQQVAVAKVGSNAILFHNGAQVASLALGTPALAANSDPLNFGGNTGGGYACPGAILCRAYGEDLTTSGITAAAQVAADYANNSDRFTG